MFFGDWGGGSCVSVGGRADVMESPSCREAKLGVGRRLHHHHPGTAGVGGAQPGVYLRLCAGGVYWPLDHTYTYTYSYSYTYTYTNILTGCFEDVGARS